jgi:hypothetical protein
MKTLAAVLLFIGMAWLYPALSHALTVDEIIKLKQGGVSDSTIELLIQRSGDARSAGVWKQDGWIVQSTESRFPDTPQVETYPNGYPIDVYPQVNGGSKYRPR